MYQIWVQKPSLSKNPHLTIHPIRLFTWKPLTFKNPHFTTHNIKCWSQKPSLSKNPHSTIQSDTNKPYSTKTLTLRSKVTFLIKRHQALKTRRTFQKIFWMKNTIIHHFYDKKAHFTSKNKPHIRPFDVNWCFVSQKPSLSKNPHSTIQYIKYEYENPHFQKTITLHNPMYQTWCEETHFISSTIIYYIQETLTFKKSSPYDPQCIKYEYKNPHFQKTLTLRYIQSNMTLKTLTFKKPSLYNPMLSNFMQKTLTYIYNTREKNITTPDVPLTSPTRVLYLALS